MPDRTGEHIIIITVAQIAQKLRDNGAVSRSGRIGGKIHCVFSGGYVIDTCKHFVAEREIPAVICE
jgi:hypothetical protein